METLPFAWYTDPEVLRLEQEHIFRRSWHYAGHLGQLPEAGSRFAARAGDVPVLVVRDEAGEVRGFLNVCRHRGSVLVEGEGKASTIQCPYHAWTYGLDGSLRAAPRSEEGLERADLGLVPVQLALWGPLVFVNPARDAQPFRPPELDLEPLRFHVRVPYALEANWKIATENYLECYHCPVAHKSFSARVETSPETYRLETNDDRWSQFSVARNGDGRRAEFHLLWPSTKVNVYPGPPNLSIGPLHPDGPERCSGFLDYFFAEDASEGDVRDLFELDDQVGREDRELVERVQNGVRSGLLEHGRLMPESEQLVAGFQRRVAETLNGR